MVIENIISSVADLIRLPNTVCRYKNRVRTLIFIFIIPKTQKLTFVVYDTHNNIFNGLIKKKKKNIFDR